MSAADAELTLLVRRRPINHLVSSGGLYLLQEACANKLIDAFSTGFPF